MVDFLIQMAVLALCIHSTFSVFFLCMIVYVCACERMRMGEGGMEGEKK